MSEALTLDQTELTEAQTHINLIQKAYRKLESAQYAARELENDFRDLINVHIQQKGGDPNLQYTLNTDSGSLEVVTEEMQQQQQMQQGNPNNGQGEWSDATAAPPADVQEVSPERPAASDIDPTGNFSFGDGDKPEEV